HELATWLGDDRRISVVPFGVDRAFFSEAPNARVRGRADWRIPNDAFVVLHVGSTVERKNVPLVIHTVARLRAQADTYLLQVGGLKEVGGEGIVVVEGRDPGAYVQALERLSDDALLREELVERGRARARTFTWQRTAEQTAAVYRGLL